MVTPGFLIASRCFCDHSRADLVTRPHYFLRSFADERQTSICFKNSFAIRGAAKLPFRDALAEAGSALEASRRE